MEPPKEKEPEKSKEVSHLPKGIILPYLIIIRIINALTIKTFFQADEYWQALEPAHQLVYGYGYLTWEWRTGLRSFIHPLLFSILFQIGELIGIGDLGVSILPKVFQAVVAAIGEYFTYRFIYQVTKNETIARWGLLISITSAFNWYIITRTFSNSLELTLTSIGLAFWNWDKVVDWRSINISLLFSAISCVIRPTNGLIWAYLSLWFAFNKSVQQSTRLFLHAVIIGSIVIGINIIIDYFYYGELTVPIWNFIKFNVTTSLSKFYGVAPWHFHIFQSVPIILLTFLPIFIYGCFKYPNWQLKLLLAFVIGTFSCIDHKEFRFIYPVQPIMFLITSSGFYHLNLHHSKIVKYSAYIIIILNTLISLFFTQVHERGVIDVIEYLKYDPDVESIGFLTPCHSTPWQSYLHRPELQNSTWFLTCEPPLHLLNSTNSSKEVESYMDESDIFYEDPKAFLYQNFPPVFNKHLRSPGREYKYEWPTHLVVFQDLEPFISQYLKDSPYQECARFFNTYFHWDDRRRGDVIVYCKWPWE
ncbi:unnamed protein product [Wickerhamomyces anomalus]